MHIHNVMFQLPKKPICIQIFRRRLKSDSSSRSISAERFVPRKNFNVYLIIFICTVNYETMAVFCFIDVLLKALFGVVK